MDRERITITIKKDLLKKVDQTIDKIQVRNRSHAIEALITQAIGSPISKAVILAGGSGAKLRPLTIETPKSLIPVHDRPVLEYLIELLKSSNICDITIALGHLGEKIKSHFGDGSRFGVAIEYIKESKPAGTAGALKLAEKKIGKEPFFVLHGDILTNINLAKMADFYHEHNCDNVMALTSVADPSVYGAVRVSGTQIVDFQEKPHSDPSVSRLVNAGIYIFNPSIFRLIPGKSKSYLEQNVIPRLVKDHKLTSYPFEGKWFDISTLESYERALKAWKK